MQPEDVLKLIKEKPTEEVLTEERLLSYLERGEKLVHYIGFEISGFVHLGTGLICMKKVSDFQKAGIKTKVFLADYHSWINRKLGGDLDTIRKIAGGYFRKALEKVLEVSGGNPSKTEFILGSELYEKLGIEYLENLIKISRRTTLSRVKRSITIMGRKEGERLDFSQLLYVPMQVSDIFSLGVNLAHGGMDQRKAHVIAIDIGEREFGYKPLAVHHHLLMGMHITERQRRVLADAKASGRRDEFEREIIEVKMSKSKPESAIFVHDSPEEIKRKINKAYCPMGETELNPILELAEYVVFPILGEMTIVNDKTGEVLKFERYNDLKREYLARRVHPADLKSAIAGSISKILRETREYFSNGKGKKYIEEMKELGVS